MEDVLDLYAGPDDPRHPQVRFDGSPVRLTGEARRPLPARPGQPARYDSDYKREGTAHLVLFVQPLRGWRHVDVTPRRAKPGFARQTRPLADDHFPAAERIRLVLDNLNTHTPAALYRVLPPAEARRIIRKLEFHHTPKHGSWLNRAECESAALAGQCPDRRIPSIGVSREKIAAWQGPRDRRQTKTHWPFNNGVARTKLKRLYPPVETAQSRDPPEPPLPVKTFAAAH